MAQPVYKVTSISSRTLIRIVASVLLLSALVLSALVLLIFVQFHPGPHPEDETYIAAFQQHESLFNELVALRRMDSAALWNSTDSLTRSRIPEQRRRRYAAILHQLDLSDISEDSTILLVASEKDGPLTERDSKGYLYSPEEPGYEDSSLDNTAIFQGPGFACRRLKDHCFLYRTNVELD
jgi:hypothetical protein